jgi:hypothetical protein
MRALNRIGVFVDPVKVSDRAKTKRERRVLMKKIGRVFTVFGLLVCLGGVSLAGDTQTPPTPCADSTVSSLTAVDNGNVVGASEDSSTADLVSLTSTLVALLLERPIF